MAPSAIAHIAGNSGQSSSSADGLCYLKNFCGPNFISLEEFEMFSELRQYANSVNNMFTLGVVLFVLRYGTFPFTFNSTGESFSYQIIARKDYVSFYKLLQNIFGEARDVDLSFLEFCFKCMDPEYSDRPCADDLVNDLEIL